MMNEDDKNKKSLIQKYNLLIAICEKPAAYREQDNILTALKSQGGLAELVLPDTQMRAVALNTLKRHADDYLEGGWGLLNKLRQRAKTAALASLTNTNGGKPASKQNLNDKISNLQAELDIERKSNMLLMMTVQTLRGELRKMADYSNDEFLIDSYLEINKKIAAQLSYNNEVNPDNGN
ncbi:hypothetical protein AB6C81_14630 [Vibrio splendidus]